MKCFTFVLTVVFLMMTSMGTKAQDISYEHCVVVNGLAYALDNKEDGILLNRLLL